MTVMQTTALKINAILKLWWVIISVISIDQQCGSVKFSFYWCWDSAQTPDTVLEMSVCVQVKLNHKASVEVFFYVVP